MNWFDANFWVSTLEFYDSERGVTWSDWRLPTTVNNLEWRHGVWDTSGQNSELAHMYYNNLGYEANYNSGYASEPNPTSNTPNPFINLNYLGHWSGTATGIEGRETAWQTHFHFGFTAVTSMHDTSFAWAVRDGDVAIASVPEPSVALLFAGGFFSLVASRRVSSLSG